MSSRDLSDWHLPDVPKASIDKILKERRYGNKDVYDLMTRIFACVYFNKALPQNALIKLDKDDTWRVAINDSENGPWTSEKATDVLKQLLPFFSRVANLNIPESFCTAIWVQHCVTVIKAGPRPFEYDDASRAKLVAHAKTIKTRYGCDAIPNKDIVLITTEHTHMEVVRSCDWIAGYESLFEANVERGYLDSRLYLFDPELMSISSRSTMLRTTAGGYYRDFFVSVYFLDEAGRERCVFNAENF